MSRRTTSTCSSATRRTGSGRPPKTATRRRTQRTGRLQVDELIAAARVPVFLLDEHQVVKPNEIGYRRGHQVPRFASGVRVHHVPLTASSGVAAAASTKLGAALLGLESVAPEPWTGDHHFEVRLPIPGGDGEFPAGRLAKFSPLISAGFCWPWSDPERGALVNDVRVDDWTRPWNVKGDRAVGTLRPARYGRP